jgi:hypothetical protein
MCGSEVRDSLPNMCGSEVATGPLVSSKGVSVEVQNNGVSVEVQKDEPSCMLK